MTVSRARETLRPGVDVSPSGRELSVEDFLTFRVNRLSNLFRTKFTAAYLKKYELGIGEWRLLAFVGHYKSLTSRDVGRLSGMDKGQISRAFRVMRERELMMMHSDLRLATTSRGRALYRSVITTARRHQAALLLTLSRDERLTLYRALDKLTGALHDTF